MWLCLLLCVCLCVCVCDLPTASGPRKIATVSIVTVLVSFVITYLELSTCHGRKQLIALRWP